jgi:hypothetical protein
MPSWMLYATAGGAWGGIHENDAIFPITIAPTGVAASFSHTQSGWVAGASLRASRKNDLVCRFESTTHARGRTFLRPNENTGPSKSEFSVLTVPPPQ